MFEYKRLKFINKDPESVTNELNELGNLNWEVVSYFEDNQSFNNKNSKYVIFLKRKIKWQTIVKFPKKMKNYLEKLIIYIIFVFLCKD